MGGAPGQGPQLHDADEARQVEHLPLQVVAVAHAAQVEQLGSCTRIANGSRQRSACGLLQGLKSVHAGAGGSSQSCAVALA